MTGEDLAVGVKLACLGLSIVLATATLVLVERPLRKTGLRAVPVLLALMIATGASGFYIFQAAGVVMGKPVDAVSLTFSGYTHYPDHDADCDAAFPQFAAYDRCRLSMAAPPEVAIIGDSHSAHYFNSLARFLKGRPVMNIGLQTCLPFAGDDAVRCAGKVDETYAFLAKNRHHQDGGSRWVLVSPYGRWL
jgi:hypothetical protein